MQESMAVPPGLPVHGSPFMAGSPLSDNDPVVVPQRKDSGEIKRPQLAVSPSVTPGSKRASAGSCEDLMKQVRQEMTLDFNEKLAERLDSVFLQGQQAAHRFANESRKQNEEISKKLVELREREAALESENAALHQTLATVLGQLALWGSGGLSEVGDMTTSIFCKAPDACPEGSSTTASEREGGGSVCNETQRESPHLGFDVSPLTLGIPPAPASESGGSNPDTPLEPPPGLPRPAAKLPEVPAFPFSEKPQVPTTPLSLSEALGLDDIPLPAPVSSSLSSAAAVFAPFAGAEFAAETYPGFPFDSAAQTESEAADGFVFSITLRKVDGCGFGLTTSIGGHTGCALQIDGVLAGGAAEAWNRQCGSSGAAEKVLLPGDSIVSVNGVGGSPQEMKQECESQQLLRLMVVRKDGPRSAPPTHTAAVSERSSQLRAEASEFVPFSADAPAFIPMGMAEDPYEAVGLPVC
jgi:hypothetical protein